MLLLDLERQQHRTLPALQQEEAVAHRADGPDHQPVRREVVAFAHATTRSASDAVELMVKTWVIPSVEARTDTEQGETIRRWNRSRWMPAALGERGLDRIGVGDRDDGLPAVANDEAGERLGDTGLHLEEGLATGESEGAR